MADDKAFVPDVVKCMVDTEKKSDEAADKIYSMVNDGMQPEF